MQKIFFTSDLHFNHKNIIKYCNRPYENIEDMNLDIIKRWNNVVSKEDIVWCLGDVAFGNKTHAIELVKSLNGRKRLIMGNHDHWKISVYLEMGFEIVSPCPIIWGGKYILSHVPYPNLPEGYINIYGHIHNHEVFDNFCQNAACVCIERFNYAPVRFEAIADGILQAQSKPKLQDYINNPDAAEILKVEP